MLHSNKLFWKSWKPLFENWTQPLSVNCVYIFCIKSSKSSFSLWNNAFDLLLQSGSFSCFIPNEDGEREERWGMISPVSEWFFSVYHRTIQLTRTASGDWLGKKAIKITDQYSENLWNKSRATIWKCHGTACPKRLPSLPPVPPQLTVSCDTVQWCALGTSLNKAVWQSCEKPHCRLFLPLCMRATFKLRASSLYLPQIYRR